VVEGLGSRLSSHVEQDANVGVQRAAKGIEEPSVRVKLLRVCLFQAEYHLAGYNALLGTLELEIGIERDLCGVLVYMGCDFALIDVIFRDALLETAHGSDGI
jgi:hypothetical protein